MDYNYLFETFPNYTKNMYDGDVDGLNNRAVSYPEFQHGG